MGGGGSTNRIARYPSGAGPNRHRVYARWWALGRMLALTRLGLGGRIGNGRQWWPWITLEDEIRALLHLLDTSVVGPVNLVAPGICRNAEFVRDLARALRRPAVVPAPALALRGVLGEMANGLLLASARVRPVRLEDSGFTFRSPNLTSAIAELLPVGQRRPN